MREAYTADNDQGRGEKFILLTRFKEEEIGLYFADKDEERGETSTLQTMIREGERVQ